MSAPDQPTTIRLRNEGRLLMLEYGPAIQKELSAEYLRISSPSAEVQGHGPDDGTLPIGKQHVRIEKIEQAGHYALRLHFDDGHDSGIYSWTYLKQLANEKQQRWQAYLIELQRLGETRDPETQVVRFMQPTSSD